MVKNENYIVIQGFMVNELGLKGNDLLIYAIIYGFSQAQDQKYTGSLQYLADWTNSTVRGVQKNLKSLLEKKLIVKEEKYVNNVKFVQYYGTKFQGGWNNVRKCMEQSSNNNIYNNIYNNTTTKENPIIFYENNFGLITPIIAEKINTYIEDGIEEELIIEAMKKAVENNARKWSYVQTILNDCVNKNIKTLHEFETQQKEYKNNKTPKTIKKEVEYNTDFSEYDKYARH